MDRRIELIIGLMRHNLRRKLSPDKFATLVGLSPSRLHYLFKAEIGMSPSRYLRSLRLERARYLLNSTHSSVKQVMIKVGVTDRSHFEREFKRLYGVTPSRYRKDELSTSLDAKINR
jgi:transcriptional regulator GlxA family with amidase domain